MNKPSITWIELDEFFLKLNPMQQLQVSTMWKAERSSNEPWLAIIKPTSLELKYYVVSLSLDAYHRFTNEVIEEFVKQCLELSDCYSFDEIEEILASEKARGNKGDMYQAQKGLLRLISPSRLIPQATSAIEGVFRRVHGNIIEKANLD